MSQSFERHTISFILRLWVESAQHGEPPRWRGQIEHVGSGEKTHFQVPAPLLAFIAETLGGFPQGEARETGTQEDQGGAE